MIAIIDPAEMNSISDVRGFRTLSPSDRSRIAEATRERHVRGGQLLFREGEPSDAVWAVKEGLVHIVKFGPDGREIVLEVIGPGELFGAIAALEERPYPASAVAAAPSTVWRTPAALARELCLKYPTLKAAILAEIGSRLRAAHERLRSIALERVEQRLARMLLELADKIGEPRAGAILVRVTRRELADMVGTTVETAIRVTSRWQQLGLVGSARRQILLCDRVGLARIAEGKS